MTPTPAKKTDEEHESDVEVIPNLRESARIASKSEHRDARGESVSSITASESSVVTPARAAGKKRGSVEPEASAPVTPSRRSSARLSSMSEHNENGDKPLELPTPRKRTSSTDSTVVEGSGAPPKADTVTHKSSGHSPDDEDAVESSGAPVTPPAVVTGGGGSSQPPSKPQPAVWGERQQLAKHASQTDYKVGYGGRLGVPKDRQDSKAVGWVRAESPPSKRAIPNAPAGATLKKEESTVVGGSGQPPSTKAGTVDTETHKSSGYSPDDEDAVEGSGAPVTTSPSKNPAPPAVVTGGGGSQPPAKLQPPAPAPHRADSDDESVEGSGDEKDDGGTPFTPASITPASPPKTMCETVAVTETPVVTTRGPVYEQPKTTPSTASLPMYSPVFYKGREDAHADKSVLASPPPLADDSLNSTKYFTPNETMSEEEKETPRRKQHEGDDVLNDLILDADVVVKEGKNGVEKEQTRKEEVEGASKGGVAALRAKLEGPQMVTAPKEERKSLEGLREKGLVGATKRKFEHAGVKEEGQRGEKKKKKLESGEEEEAVKKVKEEKFTSLLVHNGVGGVPTTKDERKMIKKTDE